MQPSEVPDSLESLKELIIQVIENEAQNCTEEDEFLDIANECWARFYTILLQYNDDSRFPLGLYVDQKRDVLLLVRKGCLSVFSKSDLTQVCNARQLTTDALAPYFSSKIDSRTLKDLTSLFGVLNCINEYCAKCTTMNEADNVNNGGQSPIDTFVDRLTTDFECFLGDVETNLKRIGNLSQSVEVLIEYFSNSHLSSETGI